MLQSVNYIRLFMRSDILELVCNSTIGRPRPIKCCCVGLLPLTCYRKESLGEACRDHMGVMTIFSSFSYPSEKQKKAKKKEFIGTKVKGIMSQIVFEL